MSEWKVLSSLLFKFAERFAVKCIGLVISVVLARLLDPETFGLLAIINVFLNLAQAFVQSGMGTALVQNKTTQEEDYSTVCLFSLGVAVILFILLYFCAPLIATFYKSSLLIWPLRVMSLSLVVGAISSVQNARLQRNMRFDIMLRCNLTATIIAGLLGVISAYAGLQLWALVVYHLSYSILAIIFVFCADRWRPKLTFSVSRAKEFWAFGWKMLVSGVLCSLYSDLRSLIIGKKYSSADLAFYTRGQQFPDVIANTLDVSIQTVMLPVMAEKQDSLPAMRSLLLNTLSLSMFVVAPVMLGLAAVADVLIPILLTEKWLNSVPLMIVFCLANITLPIMTTNLSVIKAMGRSDVYMRTEVIRRIAMLIVLLVTVIFFDSVWIIAVGYAVSSVVDCLIIIAVVKNLVNVGLFAQIRTIWKSLFAGTVMAISVYVMAWLPVANVWKLVLQVFSGILIYAILSAVLRNSAFLQMIQLLKNKHKSV